MATVLVGLVALVIILWFANKFVVANPKGVGKVLQKGGGVLAIMAAVFLGSRGELAVSTQSIDMSSNPDGAPRQAWNVGHRLGLSGRATLVPLALAWLACAAWLDVALRRRDQIPGRQSARSGVND